MARDSTLARLPRSTNERFSHRFTSLLFSSPLAIDRFLAVGTESLWEGRG